jgi:hypothetical protein
MFDPIVIDGRVSAASKRHRSSNAFMTDEILKWKSGNHQEKDNGRSQPMTVTDSGH